MEERTEGEVKKPIYKEVKIKLNEEEIQIAKSWKIKGRMSQKIKKAAFREIFVERRAKALLTEAINELTLLEEKVKERKEREQIQEIKSKIREVLKTKEKIYDYQDIPVQERDPREPKLPREERSSYDPEKQQRGD